MHAIEVSRMMEKFDPFWFEEPCPPESIDAIAEVKAKTNVPIVTGEALYTKSGFREVFEKRAADIINPDVCNTGGIMELKEIAAMAEPYLIAVSPHNPNSATVATAAAIQVSACIPNFLILEMISPESPSWDTCNEIAVDPSFTKVRNGYIKLPTSPGLGIEMDAEGIFRHPPRSFGRH